MNTLASKPKGQCPVIVFYVVIIEIGEKRCIRISFCFFLFSTQSQVRQIIIGIGRVIYQIKALSIVIRSTIFFFPKSPTV